MNHGFCSQMPTQNWRSDKYTYTCVLGRNTVHYFQTARQAPFLWTDEHITKCGLFTQRPRYNTYHSMDAPQTWGPVREADIQGHTAWVPLTGNVQEDRSLAVVARGQEGWWGMTGGLPPGGGGGSALEPGGGGVLVAQRWECAKHHGTAHFTMVSFTSLRKQFLSKELNRNMKEKLYLYFWGWLDVLCCPNALGDML